MQVMGYTSDELKLFHRVLDGAICEAIARNIRVPLHTMTKRLFDAASMGERDPEKLRSATLEDAIYPSAESLPVARGFSSSAVACPTVIAETS